MRLCGVFLGSFSVEGGNSLDPDGRPRYFPRYMFVQLFSTGYNDFAERT